MTPVLLCDAVAVVAVLQAVSPERRPALLARILRDAETACRFRARTGRAHPHLGNGSLIAALGDRPRAGGVRIDGEDALGCWAMLVAALQDRLSRRRN